MNALFTPGVAFTVRAKRIGVDVKLTKDSESHFFAGLSGDVSRGGLFVATWQPVPVGTEVAVDCVLPEGTVHVQGVVLWVREAAGDASPGMGITLEEMSPADRARVEAFCKERPPLYVDVDDGI